jgi:hypothetical protein
MHVELALEILKIWGSYEQRSDVRMYQRKQDEENDF